MTNRRPFRRAIRPTAPNSAGFAVAQAVEALESRTLLAATGLAASYFNNITLSGTPAVTRNDKTVDFAWSASPAAGVNADQFSIRWTGKVTPRYTQAYTFITRSDDGVRLWVNGQKIIDNWTRHAPTDNFGTINLTAGQSADVVMEFFESWGGATAKLSWQSASQAREVIPESALSNDGTGGGGGGGGGTGGGTGTPGTGDGLLGTYFDNMDFTAQKLARVDPTVNFQWGYGSPAGSIQTDTFAVRWTGQVQAQFSEPYTFYTRSDDGAKLTVNGQVLINKLIPQGPTEYAGTINLVAGQKYTIQLDYFERSGGATAELRWSSPSTPKQIIPRSQLYNGQVQPVTTPPAVPGGVSATALSSSQIRVNWADVATETGYKIERSPDGTTGWAQVGTAGTNATSFINSGLAANTTYSYRVRANNSAGDSGYSAVVSARTQTGTVTPPGTYQPDQIIQLHRDTTFVGDNVINTTGDAQQKDGLGDFYGTIFKIRVYNDGKADDSFIITGPATDSKWRINYYDSFAFGWNGGKMITADVTGNGWNTGNIAPGQYREYRAELLPEGALGGDVRTMTWTARSTHDAGRVDTVRGVITNPVQRKLAWRRQNFDRGGTYLMRIENQGNLPDQFTVTAAPIAAGFNVQFFDDQWGGNNVTAAVRSGAGWKTRVLQPYEAQEFRVVFSGYSDLNVPSVNLTAASVGKPDTKETLTVNMPPVQKEVTTPDGSFPIGIWTQPRSQFAKWKARGINTLVEYQGDGATLEEWTQTAKEHGLFYIRRPFSNEFLDVGDRNLLAWSLPDEPEITTRFPPSELQKWITEWKLADPNRPIWANFSGGWVLGQQGNHTAASYQPYTTLADWESSSIYPVTGWNRPVVHPGLDMPGQALDRLEKWSNGNPQFAVLESGDQELSWIQKEVGGPTPGQFRAQVWDSIIQGARGVIYFPMSFMPQFKYDNTPPEIVAEMATLHPKIQSIAGALLSPIDPPTRGLQVSGPLEGTWRVYNGKTYYIVLNFSDRAVTQSLTFQGIPAGTTSATVHGEGRSVAVANGTVTDTFAAYGVHVYQVG